MYRLALILLWLPASAAPSAQHVVAVGGGERTPEILAEIVRLGGGLHAHVVVVPLASGSSHEVGKSQAAEFRAFGAGRVSLMLDVADTKALRDATAVFFSGGDQNRLVAALRDTEALRLIETVFDRGGVVAGTSAGAAVMSRTMMTGDVCAGRPTVAPGCVETAEGFGFLDRLLGVPVVVDQHFANRDRHGRLLAAVLDGPARLGVGIDEATAFVVSRYGATVVGRGNVTVFDARLGGAEARTGVFSARGLALDVLAEGDTLAVRQVP